MKRVKIPFSLTEYKKGGYEVETRDERKARIICTDCKSDCGLSIVSLIDDGKTETWHTNHENGMSCELTNCKTDLFLTKQEFEDGDIIADNGNISIFKNYTKENQFFFYAKLGYSGLFFFDKYDITGDCHLATEEEKKKLFNAFAKESMLWNAGTKQVEDIEHKSFKPKDWCLMRTASDYAWCLCQFSNMDSESYVAIGGAMHEYCIPYNDETKHILGTTEDAPEKYKTW